ncbi:hypothetical protein D3C73_965960 [compost metagenome]
MKVRICCFYSYFKGAESTKSDTDGRLAWFKERSVGDQHGVSSKLLLIVSQEARKVRAGYLLLSLDAELDINRQLFLLL